MGPIQQLLLSEREDGLLARGCRQAGEMIRRVSFDCLWFLQQIGSQWYRIGCSSAWGVSATCDVGRDDGLGSLRNLLGVTLYEDLWVKKLFRFLLLQAAVCLLISCELSFRLVGSLRTALLPDRSKNRKVYYSEIIKWYTSIHSSGKQTASSLQAILALRE